MSFTNLKGLIGNDVEIITTRGHTFKGCVYSIDPRKESYILLTKNEGVYKVNYVNGEFIKTVSPIGKSELAGIKLFSPPEKRMKRSDLDILKWKVKTWLIANKMEVTEDGPRLKLFNTVTICPPYRPCDCYTTNVVILERVQDLLSSFSREYTEETEKISI